MMLFLCTPSHTGAPPNPRMLFLCTPSHTKAPPNPRMLFLRTPWHTEALQILGCSSFVHPHTQEHLQILGRPLLDKHAAVLLLGKLPALKKLEVTGKDEEGEFKTCLCMPPPFAYTVVQRTPKHLLTLRR